MRIVILAIFLHIVYVTVSAKPTGVRNVRFDVGLETFDSTRWRSIHEVLRYLNTRFSQNGNKYINVEPIVLLKVLFLLVSIIIPPYHFCSFIVQDPINNACMMLKSSNLFSYLDFAAFNETLFLKRVKPATEHHILPYQHAMLIG